VLDICRKGLPTHKMPKTVRMIESVPRNAYGKVQRFKLLEQLGSPQPVGKGMEVKEAGMDG
jgi:acyl-coenzyme A synthetase/AMP-(fatty) acid ligase